MNMFSSLFLVDAILQLMGEVTGNRIVANIAKVLLMPLLMLWVLSSVKEKKTIIFLLLGLFFSWWGDILLMMIKINDKIFFILGLASFLIAHINYIIYFIKELKDKFKEGFVFQKLYNIVPYIVFVITVLNYLSDSIAEVKIPVYLYCTVIALMSVAALNRQGLVYKNSFKLVFLGSLLFIISDTMIAINTFKNPIPMGNVWIMLTYICAQYLIVKGSLINRDTKN